MTQTPFNSEFANDRNNSVDRSLEATLAREDAAVEAALAKSKPRSARDLNDNPSRGGFALNRAYGKADIQRMRDQGLSEEDILQRRIDAGDVQGRALQDASQIDGVNVSDDQLQQSEGQADSSEEAGPGAPPQPGATLENESVHHITAGDVKRQEKAEEKIVLMKPDSPVDSAMKGIQTAIENLTRKIDKYLQALQSYVDAVTSTINSIQNLIMSISQEICKYMKIIMDKVMEYVLKILNKTLNKVVAALPSSFRYQFGDMKDVLTELILCLYNKMMNGMCETIAGALNDAINPDKLEADARERAANGVDGNGNVNGAPTNPVVPMCNAEGLVSRVLAGKKGEIDDANNNLVNNMNAYLEDITGTLAGISGTINGVSDTLNGLGDISNSIPDIGGSISSALNFTNIKLNVFGCELEPNVAVSDFYTFASAGDSTQPAQLPSSASVAEGVENATPAETPQAVPFAEPSRATADVSNDPIGADLDAELERARANDRSGLDDALDIPGGSSLSRVERAAAISESERTTREARRAERVARLGEDRVRQAEERDAAARRAGAE